MRDFARRTLAATWSSGTWPGPSTITCTSCACALFASLAMLIISCTCSSSWESSMEPGRSASPRLNVTSCLRATSSR